MKKAISLLLSILMLLSISVGMSFEAHAAYSSDYRCWSQNKSGDKWMQKFGCGVVAYSKLIHETGINKTSSFNPDVYYKYLLNNNYVNNGGFTNADGQNAVVAYAKSLGNKDISYIKTYTKNCNSQVLINASNGYYSICTTSSGHYFMINNKMTNKMGKIYIYDSYGSRETTRIPPADATLSSPVKYTITKVITFKYTGDSSNPASITSSSNNVNLNIQSNNSSAVKISATGDLPSNYSLYCKGSNNNVSFEWGNWNGNTCQLYIKASRVGSTTFSISLIDDNKNKTLKTIKIEVSVTAPNYTVSLNANGGSGAPSSISYYYGNTVTIPSQKPKLNVAYTVNYELNGGTANDLPTVYTKEFDYWYDSAENKYYPGNSYSFSTSKTLYAHYKAPILSSIKPTKDNYYFVGWYDSNEKDETGCPVGNPYYCGKTVINKNVTLYAMWSQSESIMFGDVNADGNISLSDVTKIFKITNGKSESDDISEFIGDVNADGKLTSDEDGDGENDENSDMQMIYSVYRNRLDYYELPAVKAGVNVSVASTLKTNYEYGENFDFDSVALDMNFKGTNVTHTVSTDVVVKGYDPYKIGTQTVTIAFYQYEAKATVTVNAPSYKLIFDTEGGYLETSSKAVTFQSKIGSLPEPEKQGYVFEGWYTSPEGGSKVDNNFVYSTLGDSTVYAHWQNQLFTVKYENINYSEVVEYGEIITIPQTEPIKKGYTFIGWKCNSSEDYFIADEDIVVVENLTFTPVWEETEKGWKNLSGYWIYINEYGKVVTGWLKDSNKWYFLSNEDGAMVTGLQTIEGTKYIFSISDGSMLTGKVRCAGKWYIMNKSTGAMLYGKVRCDGKWYIMHKVTGEMLYGKVTCDGKTYICSKSDGHIFTNQTVRCDGKTYTCDKYGVAR